jgi:SAM-dependent methyltransferase
VDRYEEYYSHLNSISWLGRLYKQYFAAQVLYYQAKNFGTNIAEIGSGIGSGLLGAYPKCVTGFEINPLAVNHCKHKNYNVHLVGESQNYPTQDGEYDVCVLDNVLEHIAEPAFVLKECARITRKNAGLIIAVPGIKGYEADADHKKFYGLEELQNLDPQWQLVKIFSTPFFVKGRFLSKRIAQYCLVAVYRKH